MNNRFDELAKGMAQSVTRRAALKKFGVGLAGLALACFGLTPSAKAGKCVKYGGPCSTNADCCSGWCGWDGSATTCLCTSSRDCRGNKVYGYYCEAWGICSGGFG